MSEGEKEPDQAKKSKDSKASGEAKGDAAESTAALLAKNAGEALIPVLITAGSLLGFVAFAGAVVLWTRLSAVGIPPEQALDVAPEGELITIGAEFLLVFGLLGALALAAVLLVDRAARPTPGMARALLVLLMLEGIVAITLVEGRSAVKTVGDAEVFALPVLLVIWATTVARFGRLADDLDRRPDETEPRSWNGLLRPRAIPVRHRRLRSLAIFGPIGVVAGAALAAALMIVLGAGDRLFAWAIGVLGAIFVIWVVALFAWDARVAGRTRETDRLARIRLAKEEAGRERRAARSLRHRLCALWKRPRCPPSDEEAETKAKNALAEAEKKRQEHPGPLRLALTREGVVLAAVSMAVAIGLVLWRLGRDEWWAAVTLAVAAIVVGALWRMAAFTHKRVTWFVVGVFLSAPLVGAIAEVVRNLDHPKVQAVALIRKSDGPKESIQGLYVTESGSRVYFANLATEGCSSKTKSGSARLFWIPKEDVLAMSIGPLQSVEQAGKSALEMSYTLTPAIETPEASVELGIGNKQEEEAQAGRKWHDTKLENAGPAVRPNLGSGLNLEPAVAEPGEEVTLRMSSPNENPEVNGFGPLRGGRNLRVGGVRADIVKETMNQAFGAEYVKLKGGRLVHLAKDGRPFVEEGGEYKPLSNASEEQGRANVYVRIEDPTVLEVDGDPPSEENEYVRVALAKIGGTGPNANHELFKVDEEKSVTLARSNAEGGEWSSETSSLDGHLIFRQAWHPGYIKFIVPEAAQTGEVTVECNQLADAQVLQVVHKPVAKIAARMRQGSGRVTFNSAGSRDEDEVPAKNPKSGKARPLGSRLKRHWTIDGVVSGHGMMKTAKLPPRSRPYSVELTVTDESGNSNIATLRLLRLPTSLFAFDHSEPRHPNGIRKARKALERAVAAEKPIEIELDGHADNPGTPAYNLRLSMARDEHVRKALLQEEKHPEAGAPTVPVQELAYGESCQLDKGEGRRPRNRRVDVFVIDPGVTVKPAKGCHPGRLKRLRWHLPPPKEAEGS
jgi:flagellar motor protein MotB